MKHYTKDYLLLADQLDDKYNPDGDGEHPGYTRSAWVRAVNLDSTIFGYWDWVHYQLQCEMEDLEKSNPYTQWEREMEVDRP